MPQLDPGTFSEGFQQTAQQAPQALRPLIPLDDYHKQLGAVHSKWLDKMLNGEMSPEEAATRARLEAHGHPAAYAGLLSPNDGKSEGGARGKEGAPQPPAQSAYTLPRSGLQVQFGQGQATPPSSEAPPSPPEAAPEAPPTPSSSSPSIPAPKTFGDFDALEAFSDKLRPAVAQMASERRLRETLNAKELGRQETLSSREGIEAAKESGRGARSSASLQEKGREADQKAKLRIEQLKQDWDLTFAKLRAKMSELHQKGGQARDIQILNILSRQAKGASDDIAKEMGSINTLAKDPDMMADLKRRQNEMEVMQAELEKYKQQVMKTPASAPTESTRKSYSKPNAPTAADLNKLLGGG